MVLEKCTRCLLLLLLQDVCCSGAWSTAPEPNLTNLDGGPNLTNQDGIPNLAKQDDGGANRWTSSVELVDLSEADGASRVINKRGAFNRTEKIWPHDIPVVFNSSYKGNVGRVKRVFRYISNRLCVRFHDVTNTYDPSDRTWFTSHGFTTDAYVNVVHKKGCSAVTGQGTTPGPKKVSPCNDFKINLHELLHVLGAIHGQNVRGRNSHLVVHTENVQPDLRSTYAESKHRDLVSYYFDPKSALMYKDLTWSANGLETYTLIRDDDTFYDLPSSRDNVIFLELNQIYRCNELFCDNNPTDCGPGYHSLVNGACGCVCPDDLDPATNCQELISQPTRNIKWPKTPIVLYGANACPKEFDRRVGVLPLTGYSQPQQDPVPVLIPSQNFTLRMPICTKRAPSNSADVDWLSWPPGGDYCIIKRRGVDCGGAFKEGVLQLQTAEAARPVGSVGDTQVLGETVKMKFCCQNEDSAATVVDLPNADPFRLLAHHSCPHVRGMTVAKGKIQIFTNKTSVSGPMPPHHFTNATEMHLFQCLYVPPVYGCNRIITLDATTRSVRVTTPGFGVAREANRRCFYGFNNTKNSRLRLTFNRYDLHENDKFLVKRYHEWQDAYRVKNNNYPSQIVSVTDYLSLEYWSSWETTQNLGLDFTVDLLLADDFCYDLAKNGEDYKGDKSVTETYEECIPWEKATSCEDFPFDDLSLVTSGNKCRNPKGALDQPWCYTFVNGSECNKRYCDVCNIKSPVDALANCADFVTGDPSFCTTAIQRFGCFKTCGFSLQQYVKGCPDGWTHYRDRCFRVFTTTLTYKEAAKKCKSFGVSGSLFQIKNEADQTLVWNFTSGSGEIKTHRTWISGHVKPRTDSWFFSDTNISMPFLNFSNKYLKVWPSAQCIQLLGDRKPRWGLWKPFACGGSGTASYICQLNDSSPEIQDKSVPVNSCQDELGLCQTVLSVFPTFCWDNRSLKASSKYCSKSCGRCSDSAQSDITQLDSSQSDITQPDSTQPDSAQSDNTQSDITQSDITQPDSAHSTQSDSAQCFEPDSWTYHRTSANSAIDPGQVMTFACNDGYYYTRGNLQRACSLSGELLGTAPVCSATPEPRDIKLETIRKRHWSLSGKTAILLDHVDYRIPFSGNITKWYYYCNNPGTIVFLVYSRENEKDTYVGSNTITCIPDWKMGYSVPVADQISVNKGDVFGAYSAASNTLSINDCNTAQDKLLVLPSAKAKSLSRLLKASTKFSDQFCAVPSLGIRLEP